MKSNELNSFFLYNQQTLNKKQKNCEWNKTIWLITKLILNKNFKKERKIYYLKLFYFFRKKVVWIRNTEETNDVFLNFCFLSLSSNLEIPSKTSFYLRLKESLNSSKGWRGHGVNHHVPFRNLRKNNRINNWVISCLSSFFHKDLVTLSLCICILPIYILFIQFIYPKK